MNTTPPTQQNQSSSPRWVRRLFRFFFRVFRVTLVVLLIVAAGLAWYLHEIGLPESVKQQLVAHFRAQGWDLEFSRIRLRGWSVVEVADLQLQQSAPAVGPRLFVRDARCQLRYSGLKDFQVAVESVHLHEGRVFSPLSTNQYSGWIFLNDLEGQVQVRTNDTWDLRFLRGRMLGLKVELQGVLEHASQIGNWKFPPQPKPDGTKPIDWSEIFQAARELRFQGQPELTGVLQGDGRDWRSLKAAWKLKVPGLQSPWGATTNLLVTADLSAPLHSNGIVHAKIEGTADATATHFAEANRWQVNLELEPNSQGGIASEAHLRLDLDQARGKWGNVRQLRTTVDLAPVPANPGALACEFVSLAQRPDTRWGKGDVAELTGTLAIPPAGQWKFAQTNLDWPQRLENLAAHVWFVVTNLHSPRLQAEQVNLSADWRWPQCKAEVRASLYEGHFTGAAQFNATNRELAFQAASTFNVESYLPLVPPSAQPWLAWYSGSTTPKLEVQGRLVWPGNKATNWMKEALPTLSLAGHTALGPGRYRGNEFNTLQSSFYLTNLVCELPDARLTRSEGNLEAHFHTHLGTTEFEWRLMSEIYPKVAKPFFAHSDAQRVFDELEFTTPPHIEADLRGAWNNPQSLLLTAHTTITNFAFRGEMIRSLQTRLQYTNEVLSFFEPVVERPEGTGCASLVVVNFTDLLLYLTNATGRVDPQSVVRMIGPQAVRALAPYQFDVPPEGSVNGVVDLKRHSFRDDLHFHVSGGPFRWLKLRLEKVAGEVHWVGETLTLTNLHGDLRSGRVDADVHFDFRAKVGADYAFKAAVIDADLKEFLSNWTSQTNQIQGRLNGELNLTRANTDLTNACQGYGWVTVRDGLLWDIPMFGLFSPALNAFVPGLGNSKARKASATYLITNSVISTTDLEIHATAMRMQFQGAVSLERMVEARVVAELWRDLPAVGFLVSKVFWPVTKMFEYKVTGTLDQPKAEPLFVVPKIILFPFHPIKSLKDLFGEEPKNFSPNKE